MADEAKCSACEGTEHLRAGSPWHDGPICHPCFMVWYEGGVIGGKQIDQTDPEQVGALSLAKKALGQFPWNGRFAPES